MYERVFAHTHARARARDDRYGVFCDCTLKLQSLDVYVVFQ